MTDALDLLSVKSVIPNGFKTAACAACFAISASRADNASGLKEFPMTLSPVRDSNQVAAAVYLPMMKSR